MVTVSVHMARCTALSFCADSDISKWDVTCCSFYCYCFRWSAYFFSVWYLLLLFLLPLFTGAVVYVFIRFAQVLTLLALLPFHKRRKQNKVEANRLLLFAPNLFWLRLLLIAWYITPGLLLVKRTGHQWYVLGCCIVQWCSWAAISFNAVISKWDVSDVFGGDII